MGHPYRAYHHVRRLTDLPSTSTFIPPKLLSLSSDLIRIENRSSTAKPRAALQRIRTRTPSSHRRIFISPLIDRSIK
ncbi:hypothetical protein ACS0TY_001439 [Phlomoides rotata]